MTQNYSFLDLLCCAFEPLLKRCSVEAPPLDCEPMLRVLGLKKYLPVPAERQWEIKDSPSESVISFYPPSKPVI